MLRRRLFLGSDMGVEGGGGWSRDLVVVYFSLGAFVAKKMARQARSHCFNIYRDILIYKEIYL